MENHIGLLTIEWASDPVIKMEIIDKNKNGRIRRWYIFLGVRFFRQPLAFCVQQRYKTQL